jgi:glucose-6-phosphate isomerase
MPGATDGSSFDRYLAWRTALDDPPVELELTCSGLTDRHAAELDGRLAQAHAAMQALEQGAIANPDENRMVGHYWLRAPGLAPEPAIGDAIVANLAEIEAFARRVHAERRFRHVLLIGIGGSALGPMLLGEALTRPDPPLSLAVLDNTDPAGIDRVLARLGDLRQVLFVVASKSGGTAETRNGMLEAQAACRRQGVDFAAQAVAVTGSGSELDGRAEREGWLRRFPMWDWVGGRTSLWSAVGLLPAALIGADVRALLAGAAAMDASTREGEVRRNPAALLAMFWHVEGGGRGDRHAVVLPYKDRLELLSRYLQQLVMESLGKELDRSGRPVFQGLSVFGNKGSTDQHAFVQQLRDGRHDFFVMFVRVLHDRDGEGIDVESGTTSGDYLDGFWLGTRRALAERGRHSATITLRDVDERSLGALLALFERAVGLYAELIDVNAYHQPGVEAGKRAAKAALALQASVLAGLGETGRTVRELAAATGGDAEQVWQVLRHLAANRREVVQSGEHPDRATFRRVAPPAGPVGQGGVIG